MIGQPSLTPARTGGRERGTNTNHWWEGAEPEKALGQEGDSPSTNDIVCYKNMIINFRNRIPKEKIKFAQLLRKDQTNAEKRLWKEIRNYKLYVKFKRQITILGFIVDFYCSTGNLIIEVDGSVHDKRKDYDTKRTNILEEKGFKVIRFTNHQIENYLPEVLEEIKRNVIVN